MNNLYLFKSAPEVTSAVRCKFVPEGNKYFAFISRMITFRDKCTTLKCVYLSQKNGLCIRQTPVTQIRKTQH